MFQGLIELDNLDNFLDFCRIIDYELSLLTFFLHVLGIFGYKA